MICLCFLDKQAATTATTTTQRNPINLIYEYTLQAHICTHTYTCSCKPDDIQCTHTINSKCCMVADGGGRGSRIGKRLVETRMINMGTEILFDNVVLKNV